MKDSDCIDFLQCSLAAPGKVSVMRSLPGKM